MNKLVEAKSLLKQTKTIKRSYDFVAKNTGEKFNLFSILGMESLEVKTHSKFIAELLDSKGSHLKDDAFFNLFIDYCNKKIKVFNEAEFDIIPIDFGLPHPKVSVELPIGKNEEGTIEKNFEDATGGRIDIFISNNKQALIIENKINAVEAHKQLTRYSNFASSRGFDRALIIFLTLDGSKPTSHIKSEENKILCLSYKEDVISWLELCKREVVDYPTIREGIGQYITLIKKLTHQTLNKNLSMEIQDIIIKDVASAKLIHDNFDRAIYKVTSEFRNSVIEKLKLELGSDFQISDPKLLSDKDGFAPVFITHKDLSNEVRFGIESFNYFKPGHRQGALFYGVWSRDGIFKEIDSKFNFGCSPDGWWREILVFKDQDATEIKISDSHFIENCGSKEFIEKIIQAILEQFLQYLNERKSLIS